MIKQIGKNKWGLYSKKSGKLIGTHPSREKALAQERAIMFSKARRGETNLHGEALNSLRKGGKK